MVFVAVIKLELFFCWVLAVLAHFTVTIMHLLPHQNCYENNKSQIRPYAIQPKYQQDTFNKTIFTEAKIIFSRFLLILHSVACSLNCTMTGHKKWGLNPPITSIRKWNIPSFKWTSPARF